MFGLEMEMETKSSFQSPFLSELNRTRQLTNIMYRTAHVCAGKPHEPCRLYLPHHALLLHSGEDLDSGSQVCAPNTLATELSLQPCMVLQKHRNIQVLSILSLIIRVKFMLMETGFKRTSLRKVVMAHAFNLSIREAKAGGSL